jgi:chloramphenicol-sensitive protein RarD
MHGEERQGMMYATACYLVWGLFPLYFRLLDNVPAIGILGNRIVWSFCFLVILILIQHQRGWFTRVRRQPKVLLIYGGAAVLLAGNWYIYIWAVNAGYVIETSLGYFINPLVSVLLAVLFLHERLRPLQWGAIGLTAGGVLFLTVNYGHLPWIALALAFSFAFYALLKKRAPLPSLQGLTLETGMLFLPALGLLVYLHTHAMGSVGTLGTDTTLLLMSTGVVTVVPLLWFASAARRIPLSMLGILQYIAPTIQFFIGLVIFHEPFSAVQLIGFAIIWSALLLFWAEGALHRQRVAQTPVVTP